MERASACSSQARCVAASIAVSGPGWGWRLADVRAAVAAAVEHEDVGQRSAADDAIDLPWIARDRGRIGT